MEDGIAGFHFVERGVVISHSVYILFVLFLKHGFSVSHL